MKRNFTTKTKSQVVFIYLISLIVSVLVITLIYSSQNIPQSLQIDIFNILFIGIMVQSICLVWFLWSFRRNIAKELLLIRKTITEIAKGNYLLEPESVIELTPETQDLFDKLQEMKDSFVHFDHLKKDKIVEHRNRILAMLNLTDSGFIIFNMKGNIVYLSDIVQLLFPSIEENTNILNLNYNSEIDNSVKKLAIQIVKTSVKAEHQSVYFPSFKKHITIRSNIIRDAKGVPIGFILCLVNLMAVKNDEKSRDGINAAPTEV